MRFNPRDEDLHTKELNSAEIAEREEFVIEATSLTSGTSNPRMVTAGVPSRTPEAIAGGRSSKGTVLRFTVTATS